MYTLYPLYTLHTLFTLYTVQTLYTLFRYILYILYILYRIYTLSSIYSIYSIYSTYSTYSIHSVYCVYSELHRRKKFAQKKKITLHTVYTLNCTETPAWPCSEDDSVECLHIYYTLHGKDEYIYYTLPWKADRCRHDTLPVYNARLVTYIFTTHYQSSQVYLYYTLPV